VSDERDAIQPELEIALARFSQVWKRPQDQLPLWLYECLRNYGEACCRRGIDLAHKRPTVKKNPWDDEATPLEIRWDDDDRG
jgi:hypothetical protein